MIWRVRDRATFEALRRHGRRVRRGPVTIVHVPVAQLLAVAPSAARMPDPQSQVRAAFAIGRKVGNAVVRNRLRRRLRSILHDLDQAGGAGDRGLAPGAYLITAAPVAAGLSYSELRREVTSACAAVAGSGDRSNRGSA